MSELLFLKLLKKIRGILTGERTAWPEFLFLSASWRIVYLLEGIIFLGKQETE
jgi:hypothetical protein